MVAFPLPWYLEDHPRTWKYLGRPPFMKPFMAMNGRGTTGSLGHLRSTWLLTTYKSWDDPPTTLRKLTYPIPASTFEPMIFRLKPVWWDIFPCSLEGRCHSCVLERKIKVDAKIYDLFVCDLTIRMRCLGWCHLMTPCSPNIGDFCMVGGCRFDRFFRPELPE